MSRLEYVTARHARQTFAAIRVSVAAVFVFCRLWHDARSDALPSINSSVNAPPVCVLDFIEDCLFDIGTFGLASEIGRDLQQEAQRGQCGRNCHDVLFAGNR